MTATLQQLALYAERARVIGAADPILEHRFSSPQAREMVIEACRGIEVLLRSGNDAGKTRVGAMLGVAMARGVREIDARTIIEARRGEPRTTLTLPSLPSPNVGIIAVESYKQAQGSTIAGYEKMLGDWPYVPVKEGGYTVGFKVKPNRSRSDNPDTWSRIYVFSRDGTLPKGLRPVHWVHADEPPSPGMWGELRMRLEAGQPLYKWMTITPTLREGWEWIREDYATPAAWKREILLSVFDNQALTAEDKRTLREAAEADPQGLTLARLYGAYVDMTGENPWKAQSRLLQALLEDCYDPIREEILTLPVERETDTGLMIEGESGSLFIWEEPIEGERYYVIGDSALGINDDKHDPLGCHVWSRGFRSPRPKLVARYNGYCGGYALGLGVMAPLGERYNDALTEPDVTGGYGQPVLRGLADYRSDKYPGGYPHINRDRAIDKRGKPFSKRLGFTVNAGNKADMIESARQMFLTQGWEVPSAQTVRCYMEAVADGNGKLLKPKGVHYEDFHCSARAAQLLLDRSQVERGVKREREIEDVFRKMGVRDRIFRPRQEGTSKYVWRRS